MYAQISFSNISATLHCSSSPPIIFYCPLREMDLAFVNIYFQYAFKNLASIKKYRVIGERVSQSLFLCENKPVLEIDRTVALHINRVQQLKSQK